MPVRAETDLSRKLRALEPKLQRATRGLSETFEINADSSRSDTADGCRALWCR